MEKFGQFEWKILVKVKSSAAGENFFDDLVFKLKMLRNLQFL
jgi:hypothetical protein